jgi:hypothetical protein
MNDWRIDRREPRCAGCERSFGEGEAIFSLLHIAADGLRREDRCPGCFEVPAPAPDRLFWRTRHQTDRRLRFAVDFEAIQELFLALEGRREERLLELRYLLALLLLRKKRLKLVGVRRHDQRPGDERGETLCLRRPRRQEEFEVLVFPLDSERVRVLQTDLARVFQGAGVESLAAPAAAELDPGGSQVAEPAADAPSSRASD